VDKLTPELRYCYDKIFEIPKEKHIHRMKNGSKYIQPLSKEEIIQVLKMHKWNVEDDGSVEDLIELIRAVELIHGVL
jgi:hypothetical protein